jgi:Lrp/AsnC family leucine-responsive transcriptional regulator
MDAIDRRILATLQAEGRLSNLELADRIGLSPSPCLRRVRSLEKRGVIAGYGARINRQRAGLDLTVFVSVHLERHGENNAERFRQRMLEMTEVVSCYIVSGDRDFLLQVVTTGFETYRRFVLDRLLKIEGVKDINSCFALDVIKEGAPLPAA